MDSQNGNPSSGQAKGHIRHTPSPRSQSYEDDISPTHLGLGITNNSGFDDQFSAAQFLPSQNQQIYDSNIIQPQQFSQAHVGDPIYAPNQAQNYEPDFQRQFNATDSFENQQFGFQDQLMNAQNFSQGDLSLFGQNTAINGSYESSMFMNNNNNDPQQLLSNSSVNPAELGLGDMSSSNHPSPTPPQLFQQEFSHGPAAQHSPSINGDHSPSFNQHQFSQTPGHSRHTSLQPESAQFANAQLPVDWTGTMPQQFRNHRRTPSEFSDFSASSAAPSPNLAVHDSFDNGDHRNSPMIHPQDPNIYQNLDMGQFSISDSQVHGASPFHGRTPAHSPIPSPRLNPQQTPLSDINQNQNPFMLSMNNGFTHNSAPDIYGNPAEQFHTGRNNSAEMGQAQQMPPPDINIEFAPASRQNSFEPPKPVPLDQDALTPPQRGRRPRASSDVTFGSGGSHYSRQSKSSSLSPGPGVGRGSSPHPARSLSPMDRLSAASPGHRRRQSTSALPTNSRDYILGLADSDHQPAAGQENVKGRSQKHPATFQCTLCPKRFTRAYNLRSHLRTHTDERPFVCTVCGKAFARQHDRKRHEGLHSGEKKFVCKGDLKQGGHWGCNRRFARADALGRHFRSEAGRICIKPLLDEEQAERQRQWQEQHFPQGMQQMPMDQGGFPMDPHGNYALPARLIAQYPALANITWSDLPQGDPGMDDDISGRSSFDASGSEYYDEGDDGGYLSGPGTGFDQVQQMNNPGFPGQGGYASDYGGR